MSGHGRSKELVRELFSLARVDIDGPEPWDFRVADERVFDRVLAQGSLGLGEAYMDGWWDARRLDEFFERVIRAELGSRIRRDFGTLLGIAGAVLFNLQSKRRAFIVGKEHYDLGNDLFERMLDRRMVYTCAYWKDATTLDEAQEAKLDLVCRKLRLRPGMRILDIGCGWGSFAAFAAERYGVSVVGITVSEEQAVLARKRCEGQSVEIRVQDYRDVRESFDGIVSLGMFEHVGYRNFRTYFEMATRCLPDEGLFLLHTIGNNFSDVSVEPWIGRYIFPNGMLPSVSQIGKAIENLFVMEDLHNFGVDYDRTLMAWHANFERHWPELREKYGERFHRMWNYYLLSCAGSFRARNIQLWQIVLSKKGITGGYESVR
ncbi:MAG: cyclopropane fatty acyl phospholipid synthase [Candidatus Moranbacteria bacterium]|nr:cyclopropane fatty acyl phospholipid synthase [Candidatus Moranbacteria bacterium]